MNGCENPPDADRMMAWPALCSDEALDHIALPRFDLEWSDEDSTLELPRVSERPPEGVNPQIASGS
jgi:hypothetical protein